MSIRAHERRLARLEAKLAPVVRPADREKEERRRAALEVLLRTGTPLQASSAFEQLRAMLPRTPSRQIGLPPGQDALAAFEALRNMPKSEFGQTVSESASKNEAQVSKRD